MGTFVFPLPASVVHYWQYKISYRYLETEA